MFNISLAIFTFAIGAILKMMSISYQSIADPFMFNIYNFIICVSKIAILPMILSSPPIIVGLITLMLLMASPFFYWATILSMIMINAMSIQYMSNSNSLKHQPIYSLLNKIGSVIGVLAIPLYLYFKMSYLVTNLLICCVIGFLFSFLMTNVIYENDNYVDKKYVCSGIISILKDSYKYKKIICAYFFASIISFFQSNVAFFTGETHIALTPCFALIFLSTKDKPKVYWSLFLIFLLISHFLYQSSIVFLFLIITFNIYFEIRSNAKKIYGDAVKPHVTAHLINDMFWALIHITYAGVFYFK